MLTYNKPLYKAPQLWRFLIICCIVAVIASVPRLFRYVRWLRDPYVVVVSNDSKAKKTIEALRKGDWKPEESDVEIWRTVYGDGKSERYAEDYVAEMSQNPMFAKTHPINFWGVVVDQYGERVSGAVVTFNWLNFWGREQGKAKGVTGDDGVIKLLNARGPSLLIFVEKAGYVQTRQSSGITLDYSSPSGERFIPDPRMPFKLVIGKPRLEQLLPVIHRHFSLQKEGVLFGCDPAAGKYTTNGPFFFGYRYGPRRGLAADDMQFVIRIRGGGLVQTTDILGWDAPQEGYVDECVITLPKNWDWKKPSPIIEAYYKLQQPERWGYMRGVMSELRPGSRGPQSFEADFVTTTNGSRWLDHGLNWLNSGVLDEHATPVDGVVPWGDE